MTTWVVISQFMIACGAGGCKCKDTCLQCHMWPNMHAPQWLHMQFHVAAKLQRQSYLKCHVACCKKTLTQSSHHAFPATSNGHHGWLIRTIDLV